MQFSKAQQKREVIDGWDREYLGETLNCNHYVYRKFCSVKAEQNIHWNEKIGDMSISSAVVIQIIYIYLSKNWVERRILSKEKTALIIKNCYFCYNGYD